jgi:hypothetical protein
MGLAMSLASVLISPGVAADWAENLTLYSWLVGAWEFEGTLYRSDRSVHHGHGTINAGWVLEGRAIQDVWVFPGVFLGTTLRSYDPELRAWRIAWTDPHRQYYVQQTGRADGCNVVQEGSDQRGILRRWSFIERSAEAFRWTGEMRQTDGAPWELQSECRARRVTS